MATVTEEQNSIIKSYLILSNLNSHIWLVTTTFNSILFKRFSEASQKGKKNTGCGKIINLLTYN